MYNQNLNSVQIANYPPISLNELRVAGIQYHPRSGLGDMPEWMPVTQEDRDHLGDVRNKKLRLLKNMAIVAIVLSIISIGIGIGAVRASAPDYNFPHSMAGGCINGIVVLLYSLLVLALVAEGKKTPTGDTTTSCFKCLTTCNTIFATFMSTAAMSAVGMAGIWGTVDCAGRTPEDDTDDFSFNGCTPNSGTLYAMAVMTLLLGIFLFGLYLTMNFMICCNARAFGVKSNYEMFADYQMLRMQTMNETSRESHQQQQRPFPPQQGQGHYQQQGYQPQQGQGHYHQQGYQPEPSAPMLSENNDNDAPPPSYSDVMHKYPVQ